MVDTASIYEPIREEMLRLEEGLREVTKVDFPWLKELLGHVVDNSGKRIRPSLTFFSAKFHRCSWQLIGPMAMAVELVHTATLVHDDTVDRSLQRRGKTTLNALWGKTSAVLLGDYLFAAASQLVTRAGSLRVMEVFSQTAMSICRGELEEIAQAHNWRQTRQDYYHRIARKTASLFAAAAETGALLSEAPENQVQALQSYGHNLGMAFQIVDDILDFTGDEATLGKPVGSDLLQGTVTLPAIMLMECSPHHNPVRSFLESQGRDNSIEETLSQIRNSAVIQDACKVAGEFISQACRALEGFPSGPYRKSLLDLADYILTRQK